MEHEEGIEKSPVATPQPQVKKFHLNKWYVITAVLIGVIVVQGFLYLSLNSSYNTLNANHKSLTSEHNNLRNEYDILQSEHSTLQGSYDSLQADYNSLQSNYDSYVSSYNNLRNQISNRASGMDGKYFITPQDPSVNNLVIQITGGWSDPSDWNEYWSDVKMMYDWVVNNIEYRSDGLSPLIPSIPSGYVEYRQEMWQLPKETLDLMQGDCEDMANLLTSMIQSYDGGKYWTECIIITGANGGHVGVQMPVKGGKLTILDPAGKYYTQTSYGSIDMKDISTEINNWLNYWKSNLGNDVHVERVFSNNIDKSFSSTSEYISWMTNR